MSATDSMSTTLLEIGYLVQSALKRTSAFALQGPGIPSVPSGGGFSPGQSQVSSQDQEKVCVLFYYRVARNFKQSHSAFLPSFTNCKSSCVASPLR